MANQPNQIKRDIRSLERWLAEADATWPQELRDKGHRALLAIKTLDQPDVPEVMVRMAAEDMANFTTAYAAFVARQGT